MPQVTTYSTKPGKIGATLPGFAMGSFIAFATVLTCVGFVYCMFVELGLQR